MTVTAKLTQSARPPVSSGARRGVSASSSAPNGFPKSARLLKHASFQHVYENGRKQFSPTMIFFYLLKPAAEGVAKVQIGLTVGRALGGAVDRNRIKRRMRDVVRHRLASLQNALDARGLTAEVVINPKKDALEADISTLRAEVERGFATIAAANAAKPGDARSR